MPPLDTSPPVSQEAGETHNTQLFAWPTVTQSDKVLRIPFHIQDNLDDSIKSWLTETIESHGGKVIQAIPVKGYILIDHRTKRGQQIRNNWITEARPDRFAVLWTFVPASVVAGHCLAPSDLVKSSPIFVSNKGPTSIHLHKSLPPKATAIFSLRIALNGGKLVPTERSAQVIVLNQTNIKFNALVQKYAGSKIVEDVSWITRCLNTGKIVPGKSTLEISLRERYRQEYTDEDDRHLVEYLAKQCPEDVPYTSSRGGPKLYKDLVADVRKYPWASTHSATSWQERYRRHKDEYDRKIARWLKKNRDKAGGNNSSAVPKPSQKRKRSIPIDDGFEDDVSRLSSPEQASRPLKKRKGGRTDDEAVSRLSTATRHMPGANLAQQENDLTDPSDVERVVRPARARSAISIFSVSSPEATPNKEKSAKLNSKAELDVGPVSQMPVTGSLPATQHVQALAKASIIEAPRRHPEDALEARQSVERNSRETSRDSSATEKIQALTTVSNVSEGHQVERKKPKGVLDDSQEQIRALTIPHDQLRSPSRARTITTDDVVVISVGIKTEADTSEHAEVGVEYAQMEDLPSGNVDQGDHLVPPRNTLPGSSPPKFHASREEEDNHDQSSSSSSQASKITSHPKRSPTRDRSKSLSFRLSDLRAASAPPTASTPRRTSNSPKPREPSARPRAHFPAVVDYSEGRRSPKGQGVIQPLPPVASGSGTTGRQGDKTPAAPLFGFDRSESNPAGIPYRRTARQSAAHLKTQSARRSEKTAPFEILDVFSASRKGEASAIQMEPLRVSRRRESELFDWQLLSPFATEDVAYANLVPAITRALHKIQVKYDFPPAEVRRRYEKLDQDLASTDSALRRNREYLDDNQSPSDAENSTVELELDDRETPAPSQEFRPFVPSYPTRARLNQAQGFR